MYILVYSVYLLEIRTTMLKVCDQDLRKENKHPIQISAPTWNIARISCFMRWACIYSIFFLDKKIVGNKK